MDLLFDTVIAEQVKWINDHYPNAATNLGAAVDEDTDGKGIEILTKVYGEGVLISRMFVGGNVEHRWEPN